MDPCFCIVIRCRLVGFTVDVNETLLAFTLDVCVFLRILLIFYRAAWNADAVLR